MTSQADSELVELHILVSGRVQGVCFRMHAQKQAMELDLSGWVRNLPDGRVELLAQGKEKQLQKFLRWCQKGPPSAQVNELEIEKSKISKPFTTFEIR